MYVYLVAYDLMRPGQNYAALIRELERLGGKRILLSTWVVPAANTYADLLNVLMTYGDGNDRFLVVRIDAGTAWGTYGLLPGLRLLQALRP